jgi:hypothetical protein
LFDIATNGATADAAVPTAVRPCAGEGRLSFQQGVSGRLSSFQLTKIIPNKRQIRPEPINILPKTNLAKKLFSTISLGLFLE